MYYRQGRPGDYPKLYILVCLVWAPFQANSTTNAASGLLNWLLKPLAKVPIRIRSTQIMLQGQSYGALIHFNYIQLPTICTIQMRPDRMLLTANNVTHRKSSVAKATTTARPSHQPAHSTPARHLMHLPAGRQVGRRAGSRVWLSGFMSTRS
jgi:hypothetical protein